MVSRRTRIVAVLVASALGPCAVAGALPLVDGWSRDPVWDDGLAEVAVYEASRVIYGAPRPYEAVLLTVKEDFDRNALVKADPPYGDRAIVTVLKQNAVREIATPNYDYRIMTSTFVEREDPSRLVKLTSGSHEWCGNTWKAVRSRGGQATYDWSSYFDGEGDGVQKLDPRPGDLFEDQLPLALRGLEFRPGLEFEARLFPSLAHTHAGPVEWRAATFVVAARETVVTPARAIDAWRIDVETSDGTTSYWFDAAGTHPLVRMESSRGDRLRLTSIERRAYWKLPR